MSALSDADRPLTPEEILASAKEQEPSIGIATVYRSIRFFLESEQIVEVKVPGEASRYELTGKDHHHHFQCRDCGRLFEVEGCPKDIGKIVPKGFKLESHDITLNGHCRECK